MSRIARYDHEVFFISMPSAAKSNAIFVQISKIDTYADGKCNIKTLCLVIFGKRIIFFEIEIL